MSLVDLRGLVGKRVRLLRAIATRAGKRVGTDFQNRPILQTGVRFVVGDFARVITANADTRTLTIEGIKNATLGIGDRRIMTGVPVDAVELVP